MFCRNCGNEVEKNWKVCPKCGKELHNGVNKYSKYEDYYAGRKEKELPKNELEEEFNSKSIEKSRRIILKILTLISIACFFCPLYMVSCAGKEIISLNGVDLTLGFQYMGEEYEGNLIFGALLVSPIIGLLSTCKFKENIEWKEYYESVKTCAYLNSATSGVTVILTAYLTYGYIPKLNANETTMDLEVIPCKALDIIILASCAAIVVAGYIILEAECQIKKEENPSKAAIIVKYCFNVFKYSIVPVVFLVMFFVGG